MGIKDFITRKIEDIKYEKLSEEEKRKQFWDEINQKHEDEKQKELTIFWNEIDKMEEYLRENKNVKLLDLIEIKPCLEFSVLNIEDQLSICMLFLTKEYEYFFSGHSDEFNNYDYEEAIEFLREDFVKDYEECVISQYIMDTEFHKHYANFGIRELEDRTELAIMYTTPTSFNESIKVVNIPEQHQDFVETLIEKLNRENLTTNHLVTKEVATEAHERLSKLIS